MAGSPLSRAVTCSFDGLEDVVEGLIGTIPGSSWSSDARQLLAISIIELATNAFRHSAAKSVQLQARTKPTQLIVTLCYEGCDFDPTAQIAGSKGLGLLKSRVLAEAVSVELTYVHNQGSCELTIVGPHVLTELRGKWFK